jgi:general stress protein 26
MSSGHITKGEQPADPYKAANMDEVSLEEKIRDLVTFVEKCKFCMMTTRIASSGKLVSRCMALAGKEHNDIDMVFHANVESGKTDDLKSDHDINLGFLNSVGEWASISGTAEVVTDREEVRKYYSPVLKAWIGDLGDGKHDGGPEDPRICLIKVKAGTAQYAISRKGIVGSAIEYAKGVYEGNPPQINKLRYIDETEINQCKCC